MDALDLDLLRLLREDARASNVELARRLGVSEKTVRQRIVRLVDSAGLRFRADVGHAAGPVQVVYLLTTRAGRRLSEADRLARLAAIDVVRLTTGDCDIVAEASFVSSSDALHFAESELAAASGIVDVRSIPVIGDVRSGNLPDDDRLRAFDAAAGDLNSTEDVLDLACDAAAALYGCQRVFAGLLASPDDDVAAAPLFSPAIRWRGLSSRYIAGIYDNLRRGRGVPTARSRGQHLFVADALDDPTFAGVADLVRAEGFRSFLSLPIMLEHRHLGNLNLYFDEVISYDPDLVAKGQELADVVAAHLDRVSG